MSESLPSRNIPGFANPFTKLYERPHRSPIETFEGDGKNWLVRSFDDKRLRKFTGETEGTRTFLEYVDLVNNAFTELKDKYGIRVPMHSIAGEDERGEDTLFIFTAYVEHEEHPADLSEEDKERRFAEQEQTLRNVLRYFKEKTASKEPWLWDIAPLHQYQYGNLEGETENHLYLVETYPYMV